MEEKHTHLEQIKESKNEPQKINAENPRRKSEFSMTAGLTFFLS
jgi:hypothetical protein